MMGSESTSVIAYLRVSTELQKRISLGVQEDRIGMWSNSHGLKLIKTIAETHTGRTAKRKGLQDAVSLACETGATIVTYDMTRLFRNARHALNTFDRLEQAGAAYASVSDDINTRNNSAYAKLFRTILSAIGEFVADQSGEKVALSNAATVKRLGHRTNGVQPAGVMLGEDGHRIPCPEELSIIEAAKQAVIEVSSPSAIADMDLFYGKWTRAANLLNERGVLTISELRARRKRRDNGKCVLWTGPAVKWWTLDEKKRKRVRREKNKARKNVGLEAV